MNRLRNYKRYSDSDKSIAKNEMYVVFDKHEVILKNKIIEFILHTYHNSIQEIEHRKLSEKSGTPPPRIEYFLRSVLSLTLEKIHKGDKLKAYELLDEISNTIIKLKKLK